MPLLAAAAGLFLAVSGEEALVDNFIAHCVKHLPELEAGLSTDMEAAGAEELSAEEARDMFNDFAPAARLRMWIDVSGEWSLAFTFIQGVKPKGSQQRFLTHQCGALSTEVQVDRVIPVLNAKLALRPVEGVGTDSMRALVYRLAVDGNEVTVSLQSQGDDPSGAWVQIAYGEWLMPDPIP